MGTWMTAPVSIVAGLVEPWTVSPLKPGSVWTMVVSMNIGGVTPMSSSSAKSSWQMSFSRSHLEFSPTMSSGTGTCS